LLEKGPRPAREAVEAVLDLHQRREPRPPLGEVGIDALHLRVDLVDLGLESDLLALQRRAVAVAVDLGLAQLAEPRLVASDLGDELDAARRDPRLLLGHSARADLEVAAAPLE